MQHRLNVLKGNAFEAALFLTVALASLGVALAVMTIARPVSWGAALLAALAAGYWASVGLFRLGDRAASRVRARLHQTAHCTDCTAAALRD
ncbi:hypothetical protein OG693_39605 (plasmid) [Streptomyces sp. NBC_01259]|uniref:hypothetical protein n=1 Tax=Streptomyces sp. NBC_01259 TaxID=2903800 RepID=UPI002F90AB4D